MTTHILIEWSASPGPISGYNVYRGGIDGNESNMPLNNFPVTDTFYNDYTVFPGQVYCYIVTAVLNGVESASSLKIFTEPIAFTNSPLYLPLTLGAFDSFGLLASSTITNVPGTESQVAGDVGVFPGSSITGFETVRISGAFHLADYVSGYAQNSLTAAFTAGMALSGDTQMPLTGGTTSGATLPAELGGLVLTPGVYKNLTSIAITGVLVLDGQGNPNASWVFQIGTTLTTAASNSHVVLRGGAQSSNILWLVGSSATIGVDTTFAGSIIAYASITVNTNAVVDGKLGARTGAITLDNNSIVCYGSCYQPLAPSVPNTPPAPPAAPSNIHITDLNGDGIVNNSLVLPNVTTTSVTNVTNFSITIGGDVTNTGNDIVTERGICWGLSTNPTITGTHLSNGSGLGTYSILITGLTPVTTYYLRAYAINSIGVNYGDNVIFATIA